MGNIVENLKLSDKLPKMDDFCALSKQQECCKSLKVKIQFVCPQICPSINEFKCYWQNVVMLNRPSLAMRIVMKEFGTETIRQHNAN